MSRKRLLLIFIKLCKIIFAMEITYLGMSSFKIKGKSVTVVTDPFSSEMTGFRFPKVEAEIVTVSHDHKDHNFFQAVGGAPFIVSQPGEYEIKGVSIFGYQSFHDNKSGEVLGTNTIYLIEIDDLKICHLGDLGCSLSGKILEEISAADIMMIPVGGKVTIGPEEAAEIIKQTEPYIILPMHYKTADLNQAVFGDLLEVKDFLSDMGVDSPEKLEKLSVSKDKLPEEAKIILLERRP